MDDQGVEDSNASSLPSPSIETQLPNLYRHTAQRDPDYFTSTPSQTLRVQVAEKEGSRSASPTPPSSLRKTERNEGEAVIVPSFVEQYRKDPRYKKYVQLVEKNLQSFDNVNEWADVIAFLGKLLRVHYHRFLTALRGIITKASPSNLLTVKINLRSIQAFQAYPQFSAIPRKLTVAKRLAQCLNPALPAGVHQKTLEVYGYIFESIGHDQLSDDLSLWSSGLFPFVQFAAMTVKPQLLALFEQHYFPLRERLKPAMRSFIIALLPAIEEEGSEYFDKVNICKWRNLYGMDI
ncbi:Dopey, N-terminal-domain-containing protein [Endogone sp. FLAS-F59071]|nr:Dopey, N-terminal-domain-containing protein [Endogone sp. FLAS-F59071]|eukprot:RUS22467.1 Dopey, N-terminal-domain-containing protein [Endogone sp. FLAS-F59071]